ncbi:hypothetical protein ABZ464_37440 [Streptomyces sp. NPDC005820]|uniref:hypothetical protein n=1 Tax=Streptomyces sp. NPDC005820 TaxID=3157069 RepID=UPI0033D82129
MGQGEVVEQFVARLRRQAGAKAHRENCTPLTGCDSHAITQTALRPDAPATAVTDGAL